MMEQEVAKGTKWQRVKRGVESVVSCLLIAGSEKDRDSSGDDGGRDGEAQEGAQAE